MCTRTNQGKLKTADKDITVYKLIDIHPEYRDCFHTVERRLLDHPQKYDYMSYYLGHIINQDCVENKLPYKAKGTAKPGNANSDMPDYKYRYTDGLIHSFKYKKDATKTDKSFENNLLTIMYKCTIPKGTKYVLGVDDKGFEAYASKQIVFNEPVYFGRVAKKWYDKLIKQNKNIY